MPLFTGAMHAAPRHVGRLAASTPAATVIAAAGSSASTPLHTQPRAAGAANAGYHSHAARRLEAAYGREPDLARLLDRATVYVDPRLKPDAAEVPCGAAVQERTRGRGSAYDRDDDRDAVADADDFEDLDGDVATFDVVGRTGEESRPGNRHTIAWKDRCTARAGARDGFYGAREILTVSNARCIPFRCSNMPADSHRTMQNAAVEPSTRPPRVEVRDVPGARTVAAHGIARDAGPRTVAVDSGKGGTHRRRSR